MRRRSDQRGRHLPLGWNVLAVAAFAGVLVVFSAWWFGPDLFGRQEQENERVVPATVTMGASCSEPDAEETVRFELDGETRNGTLGACGHDREDQVEIAVPAGAGSGLIDVRIAATARGNSDLRRPVGLGLLALSCAGGGMYAFLVVRGPRQRAVLI
ncbi:hypothetical protein [Amycolatopsis aidingensis]|uniref:hypothetical protein n=1 Tax=Amycolatopsis aidingensis TaxID=2842453 RepID=UPI001E3875DA|nr:hypothetical protein [Amycolatopsis aidingensis]